MPYCVKCGVELGETAGACPLCQTPVLLPDAVREETALDSLQAVLYPERLQRQPRNRINLVPAKSLVILASFLLAIPFLITLIADVRSNGAITWSFYPMASLVLLWLMLAYPVLLRRHPLSIAFTVDFLATAIFLVSLDMYADRLLGWSRIPALSLVFIWLCVMLPVWLWERKVLLVCGWLAATTSYLWVLGLILEGSWFVPLALPLVLVFGFYGMGLFLVGGERKHTFLTMAVFIWLTTLLLVAVDLILQQYLFEAIQFGWSPLAAAVGVPLGALFLVIHYRPDLRNELHKKFHL